MWQLCSCCYFSCGWLLNDASHVAIAECRLSVHYMTVRTHSYLGFNCNGHPSRMVAWSHVPSAFASLSSLLTSAHLPLNTVSHSILSTWTMSVNILRISLLQSSYRCICYCCCCARFMHNVTSTSLQSHTAAAFRSAPLYPSNRNMLQDARLTPKCNPANNRPTD